MSGYFQVFKRRSINRALGAKLEQYGTRAFPGLVMLAQLIDWLTHVISSTCRTILIDWSRCLVPGINVLLLYRSHSDVFCCLALKFRVFGIHFLRVCFFQDCCHPGGLLGACRDGRELVSAEDDVGRWSDVDFRTVGPNSLPDVIMRSWSELTPSDDNFLYQNKSENSNKLFQIKIEI